MKSHYLFPGQFIVEREPCLVTTILGSCVAVALHDPLKRITGLNHYLLPRPAQTSDTTNLRYGSVSLQQMIDDMKILGAATDRLQAKVYGGARVLDNLNLGESIGTANIEFALSELSKQRIAIVEKNVGGTVGRKIILNTSDFSIEHQLMGGQSKVDAAGGHCALLSRTIRVVLVDDSVSVRTVFKRVLEQSGRIQVVGTARDAFEAREVIVATDPDVILLDIEMPQMSGVQFLEKLMQHYPVPTIMVSSLNPQDDAAVRALDVGALEFVHKPDQFDTNVLRVFAEHLVQKVIAAASSAEKVKSGRQRPKPVKSAESQKHVVRSAPDLAINEGIQLILVGGNGGAHADLQVFLSSLPVDTPPVLVAVSSVSDHLDAFLGRWRTQTQVHLKEAADGLVPQRGTVYFSPPRVHLALEILAGQTVMKLREGAPVCLQKPSSDVLFESALKAFSGPRLRGVVAFLMSGFGSDGVQALLHLRDKGARTIVSHPASSLFGFAPQAAIQAGAADDVMRPEDFAQALMRLRSRAAV
jgi:two-component system chemotaxis response regulator CheB